MCGISGIVTRNKLSPERRASVSRIHDAQIHRGPDGEGEYAGAHVMLASRRLSIIDLAGGWQPLYNSDKSLVLIINGEIYNYLELRKRLKSSGYVFNTDADGEVILHLYDEDPEDFLRHLRGMFAFALWDTRRGRLTLARDRMGEKPMYLFERDGEILFASELKALLHSGLVPFELDPHAIDLYFHYQYVPEPLTPIKGVRKLDAATVMTIDVESWQVREGKYWNMADAPPLEGDPGTLLRASLEETSGLIIRSDVPVGVALSGGLDSSIVAAFAARRQPDLTAFCVGYAGRPESDERTLAAETARHLNIEFAEVELSTESIVESFSDLNYWRDDPIADIAGFGYHAVMRLARERGVPVMLQGQGGDELFWGYPQMRLAYDANLKNAALRRRPFFESLRQSVAVGYPGVKSLGGLVQWTREALKVHTRWTAARVKSKEPARMTFYDVSLDFLDAAANVRPYYTPELADQVDPSNSYSIFNFPVGEKSIEIALTELACATYLRANGIVQGDRLGMASSVEMRLPLVDHRFVETVIGLRKVHSDARLEPKSWLKDAAKGLLPQTIMDRPKRGFAPPTREWHAAIFSRYGTSLCDGFLTQSGILSREGALKLAEGDFSATATSPLSFKALVLEQWCRQMSSIRD